jgi:hypothetical protein
MVEPRRYRKGKGLNEYNRFSVTGAEGDLEKEPLHVNRVTALRRDCHAVTMVDFKLLLHVARLGYMVPVLV